MRMDYRCNGRDDWEEEASRNRLPACLVTHHTSRHIAAHGHHCHATICYDRTTRWMQRGQEAMQRLHNHSFIRPFAHTHTHTHTHPVDTHARQRETKRGCVCSPCHHESDTITTQSLGITRLTPTHNSARVLTLRCFLRAAEDPG